MKAFGKILLALITSCGVLRATKKYTGEEYAKNYFGHEKEHLEALIELQKRSLDKSIIYFAGDSALDNKYWVKERQPPVNDLDKFFEDEQCVPDVEYWLNYYLDSGKQKFAAVNTAVETARLKQYANKTPILSTSDAQMTSENQVRMTSELIRNNITPNDYLVVNVGGNDVLLEDGQHRQYFDSLFSSKQAEKEDALKFFIKFFRDETQAMISNELVSKQKPKGVVICTFYMPSWDANAPSWTKIVKKLDGRREEFLAFARKIYTEAVSQIQIEGTQVIPLPFYETLTGDDFGDYIQRVEPSSQGGKKMARAIYEKIFSEKTIEKSRPSPQKQDKKEKQNQDKPSKTSKKTKECLRQSETLNPKNNSISLQTSFILGGGLLIFLF